MPETTDHPPTTNEPPAQSTPNRFFGWLRRADVPRRPGWIGGVCAGVADRLGIDVVIVRGIVVVVAVLGGPAFLLYAAAWLLLPDQQDRIHLERLLRGVFDQAIVGIVAIFLLGLLPVAQGFWSAGAVFWSGNDGPLPAIGRTLWTLAVIAAGIWFIVWLARRANRSAGIVETTPATTDDRPETVPDVAGRVDSHQSEPPAHPSTRPLEPTAGAPAEELAAWRVQHAEWKREVDEWKRREAAGARDLRQLRSAESRERAASAAAATAERRRLHRLANPRIGFPWAIITLGGALVAGAIAALLAASDPGWSGFEALAALAVATLVIAASIIVAGLLRRRSGFLGFIATLLVLAMAITAFIPRDRQLVAGSASFPISDSGRYAQLAGTVRLFDADTSVTSPAVINLWQGLGNIDIVVPADLTVKVIADTGHGVYLQYVYRKTADGGQEESMIPVRRNATDRDRHLYSTAYGAPGRPDVTVRVWQGNGSITVQDESLQPATTDTNNGGSQ